MQSHNVQPVHKNKPTMIVGRGGHRGKTSGRGGKGQTARAGNKRRPELRDFIKRIPKLRGRGKSSFKSFASKPVNVSLEMIEATFSAGEVITPKILVEKKLVSMLGGNIPKIKIIGGKKPADKAEFSKKVTISGCIVSVGAKASIEKAGGSVTVK